MTMNSMSELNAQFGQAFELVKRVYEETGRLLQAAKEHLCDPKRGFREGYSVSARNFGTVYPHGDNIGSNDFLRYLHSLYHNPSVCHGAIAIVVNFIGRDFSLNSGDSARGPQILGCYLDFGEDTANRELTAGASILEYALGFGVRKGSKSKFKKYRVLEEQLKGGIVRRKLIIPKGNLVRGHVHSFCLPLAAIGDRPALVEFLDALTAMAHEDFAAASGLQAGASPVSGPV